MSTESKLGNRARKVNLQPTIVERIVLVTQFFFICRAPTPRRGGGLVP